MSIEAGRAYFRQFGMEDRVQEFTVSSATVDLAAKALGVEGARIAKTLSFKTADGCIDPATSPLVKQAGANVLVAGCAVFRRCDRAAAIAAIRNA